MPPPSRREFDLSLELVTPPVSAAFVARADELNAPVRIETHPNGRHAFAILDDDDGSREIIIESVEFMRRQLA